MLSFQLRSINLDLKGVEIDLKDVEIDPKRVEIDLKNVEIDHKRVEIDPNFFFNLCLRTLSNSLNNNKKREFYLKFSESDLKYFLFF